MDPGKIAKLIARLERLVSGINGRHNRAIHRHVSQFYYMQKIEELKLLTEQLEEAQEKLTNLTLWMEANYTEVFCQWQKDVRWLNRAEAVGR